MYLFRDIVMQSVLLKFNILSLLGTYTQLETHLDNLSFC